MEEKTFTGGGSSVFKHNMDISEQNIFIVLLIVNEIMTA